MKRRGIYADDLWIRPKGIEGPRVIVLQEDDRWTVFYAWKFNIASGQPDRVDERRFDHESDAAEFAIALVERVRSARRRRHLTRPNFVAALTDLGVRVTRLSFSWDPDQLPDGGYLFLEDNGATRAVYCERGECDHANAYVAQDPSEAYGFVLDRVAVFHDVPAPSL
jgi:hypothetical protein